MEVVWHQDEFVEKIGVGTVGEQIPEEELGPRLGLE
jgi:hypothetical protein